MEPSVYKTVKGLFSKVNPNSLGKIYGKWKVIKSSHPIHVEMYEKGLVELDSSIKTLEFHFDIKYSFNKETLEVKF